MTDYRLLTYVDSKLQVDSAIRDEDGIRIKTNYAKKTEIPTKVSDLQNDTGFITGLGFNELSSHPTTLQGYGITDANINTSTGTITLGANSITPLSSEALQNYVTLNTAQTITANKVFADNIGLSKSGESLISFRRTDGDIGGAWKRYMWMYGADNSWNVPTQVIGVNEGTKSQVILEANNGTATTQMVLNVDGNTAYVTAPYRPYNSGNINDVVTIGMLVDTSHPLTFKGLKYTEGDFHWRDPTHARNDTFSARTWMSPQMRMLDKNNNENARIQVMYDPSGKHELHIGAADSSGTEKVLVVNSAGYVTAPYRTANITNDDVLTAGNGVTLSTAQTIPGVKTFSDVVYIQSSTGSYREGLRINRATSGWATIVLGATQNSTSGLSEGWSINRDTSGRLLMSAKDSSYSTALFYGTYDSTASKHTLTVPGNFVATQKDGSVTKTYTTGADTNMNILARVNNYTGNASCRIRVEVSGSNGIKTMYINAVWAGRGQALTIESVYDVNNCFRYVRTVVPNNTSYYTSNPPEIQLQQVSALARTVKATILESSGDVVLMDNLTTVGNTTNRNNRTYDVNNTVGIFDSVGYVQNSGWASGAWDTNDNDRFKFGEAVVAGSLVAIASDGLAWKIRNTAKEFRLPLVGGRATGTFAANASYGRVSWSRRGLPLTNLTDATLQGSAFSVPTWAIGNTIYMRGSLSNGNFKPDGTLSNAMANGYTWIPIGRVEKVNNDTATYFTSFMQDCSAYTLDSNGKLTHIDGKQIYNPTVNNASFYVQGNGTTASTFTANASSNVTLNIKGSGSTTVSKSANNEITVSTPSITGPTQLTITGATKAYGFRFNGIQIIWGYTSMNDSTSVYLEYPSGWTFKDYNYSVVQGQVGHVGGDQYKNGWTFDVYSYGLRIYNNCNANAVCSWIAMGLY